MEVVGFTAAAISITKTVKTLIRFTKLLYHAARDSPSVAQQIRQFALSVRNPAEAANLAIIALSKKENNLASPVIQHMNKINHLQDLAEETSHLDACVKDFRDRVLRISSRFEIVTSIKWAMLKPEMEAELCAPLTSLVTTLSLTVNVILLDDRLAQLRENGTEDVKEEMYALMSAWCTLLE
jgi:hypothetical protein